MKTKLLSMALLASSFVFSQQAQTFSEVTIQNYSPLLYLKRSVNDGGFIRGIQTQYQNGGNGWFFGDLYGTYWVVSKGDHNDAKFLINENGNVGIGTVGPLSKLHVAGTIMAGAGDSVTGVNAFSIPYANGSICNWGSLRSTGSSYMSYGVKASGTNAGWLSSSGDTSFVKTAITLDDGGFRLLASSSQKVAIDSPVTMPEILKVSASGNALLQGKFEAKEIKVTLSPTADFVFAENYDLPKLEDIEKHIKEKKHLPEIASAKVMEKEGVNVGEFQIKLLQKIEELTLYSIEQNKQLKALQQENKILKSQSEEIQELKKQVQMLLNMKK
ncbi:MULTISPECIES: hypothetical protein [Chryseobacterium]|uniref:hypothetical protein n=1 Tax=Chryseobacterium TaxID=59732 RepID=UPI000788EA5D|nr:MULTISPECIES: hypothetical protein [Chryseobacterium]KYH06647.1 hypothetical protein A1704_23490 [Chryseobacterium cucumeris]WFB70006.1 hypothetical protein PZ898_11325 [Chryseobacterium sp. WX]